MSIEDFKGAIRDKGYSEWFKKSAKSIFIQTTKELRPVEQTSQKTSFLITEQDIANIGAKLAGRGLSPQELSNIRNDLIASVKRKRVIVRKDNSLFFPVIDFETGISNVLKKGFDSIPKTTIVDKITGKEREVRVSDFFQKGHVFSVATNVAEQTRRNLLASNAAQDTKNTILPILENLISQLKSDDLASSNVKSIDFDLYAKYSKNPYKYIVEMQPEEVNRASGTASAPITNALRRYFDPANYVQIEKFFKKRATEDSFIQKLIMSRGSPSYLQILETHLVDALKGKVKATPTYSIPRTKLSQEKIKVDNSKYSKDIKNTIQKVKKLATAVKKAAELAKVSNQNRAPESLNLTSLRDLINEQLQSVVSANMGDGNSRNVLNYRTGRLASSAKVEYLTESRAGMITAFYSYMKNPYATFSQGGRQSTPGSRDPKLLISKSIREIAATQVANRLRAVNV